MTMRRIRMCMAFTDSTITDFMVAILRTAMSVGMIIVEMVVIVIHILSILVNKGGGSGAGNYEISTQGLNTTYCNSNKLRFQLDNFELYNR